MYWKRKTISAFAGVMLAGLFATNAPAQLSPVDGQVLLFDTVSLQGWEPGPGLAAQEVAQRDWAVVEGGVIRTAGGAETYLATAQTYRDYIFTAEYRWPETPGKASVALHASEEFGIERHGAKVVLDAGLAGRIEAMGAFRSSKLAGLNPDPVVPEAHVLERPAGEWNVVRVVVRDNDIEVFINGGPGASLRLTNRSYGSIALDGGPEPVEWRNLFLQPLDVDVAPDPRDLPFEPLMVDTPGIVWGHLERTRIGRYGEIPHVTLLQNGETVARQQADEYLRFTLGPVEAGTYALAVEESEGNPAMRLDGIAVPEGEVLEPITLETGSGSIRVTLIDEKGVPLSEAAIYVAKQVEQGAESAAISRDGRSSEEGVYVAQDLPSGVYEVTAEADPAYAKTTIQVPPFGEARQTIELYLSGKPVRGYVTDADGNRLSGITVALLAGGILGSEVETAQTGPQGEFQIVNIPPGEYVLRASSEDYIGPRVGVTVPETGQPDPVAIALSRMQAAGKIEGTLANIPPGARVYQIHVTDQEGNMHALGFAFAARKAFSVPDVPPGAYKLQVRAVEGGELQEPIWQSEITVGENETLQLDIDLAAQAKAAS